MGEAKERPLDVVARRWSVPAEMEVNLQREVGQQRRAPSAKGRKDTLLPSSEIAVRLELLAVCPGVSSPSQPSKFPPLVRGLPRLLPDELLLGVGREDDNVAAPTEGVGLVLGRRYS